MKARQEGFYIAPDSMEFHLRPKTGDRMIRPKKKKEPKPRKPTPYKEVMKFYSVLRKRTRIFEEYGVYEDLNGILHIKRNGAWGATSSEESAGILTKIESQHPDLPKIPALSDAAQRLKYVLEHEEKRKPPVTDHLAPRPAKDPFGKPLK